MSVLGGKKPWEWGEREKKILLFFNWSAKWKRRSIEKVFEDEGKKPSQTSQDVKTSILAQLAKE